MPIFQVFVFLQILDVLTTMIALRNGGFETNPIVKQFMSFGPAEGLIAAKLVVVAIAAMMLCWQRYRVVSLANYVYAVVVCWNLTVLFLG